MDVHAKKEVNIANNKEVEKLLLDGAGLRVTMCIYDRYKTVDVVVAETQLPVLKVKLLLNRLYALGVIEVSEKMNSSGVNEKFYRISPSMINIISDNDSFDSVATAALFSEDTSRILNNISKNRGAGLVKHMTIKTHEKNVNDFIKELDSLLERYACIEESSSDDVYTLIAVLGLNQSL